MARLVSCALAAAPLVSVQAQLLRDEVPEEAAGVTVDEKLGEYVPGDIEITNSRNETVLLGDYFDTANPEDGKPIVLALVYYRCPIVCDLVLERLNQAMAGVDYDVGEDYKTVVISFDPSETVSAAAEAQAVALANYGRPAVDSVRSGYAFHVTDEHNALRLQQTTGFNVKKLPNGEYSHPVALMILTPDGKMARYLYGFDLPPNQLRMALLEASQGSIAESLGDIIAFACFRYDPNAGAYTLVAFRVMQGGAILSAVLLGLFILIMKLTENSRRTAKRRAAAPILQDTAHDTARDTAMRRGEPGTAALAGHGGTAS